MKWLVQCYRVHFLWAELALAILITTAVVVWVEWLGGKSLVDATLKDNRAAVYGTLATIFGSLLGFVITAASIVLGFSASEHLAIVRESKHYPTLWRVFAASIRALALATIATLAALIIDRDTATSHPAMYIVLFASILAIFRLARCVWILENVTMLVARPPRDKKQKPPSESS